MEDTIKVKTIFTIEAEYEFNEKECLLNPNEGILEYTRNWIQEDFNKILTRADNVLPYDYTWDIKYKYR